MPRRGPEGRLPSRRLSSAHARSGPSVPAVSDCPCCRSALYWSHRKRRLASHRGRRNVNQAKAGPVDAGRPLRRRAEQLLSERCAEMTEGEMVALAHIVGRFLIKALSQSERPRVVSALLGNAHLVEEDVVAIARSSATPPEILRAVARSDRWSSSRAVRLALTRNPATPVPESLRCLGGLLAGDLEALARDARVPKIVRIGAERRLGGEKVSSREPRPQVHQRPVS